LSIRPRLLRNSKQTAKSRPGQNWGGSASQALTVIEAVSQEFPDVIDTQAIHNEVPRTSCKLGHTQPSKSWALPPAHLPEHVSLWTLVSAPVRRRGWWSSCMNPARITSPWQSVQNVRANPVNLLHGERKTRAILAQHLTPRC